MLDPRSRPAPRPAPLLRALHEHGVDWVPCPPIAERLDHLFVTRAGLVDVPPSLTGTYAELIRGASQVRLAGVPVQVCAPEAVLDRAEQYAAVRRRWAAARARSRGSQR